MFPPVVTFGWVAGETVIFSRPAVVVVADAVLTAAIADDSAAKELADVVAAEDCNGDADATVTEDDDGDDDDADVAGSVSSGGLGGGVAKPDQHVDGELPLDVMLLAQSRPTSTSTRVDHVVSHGDSDRVGEEDTIGSSFR